MLLLNLFRNNPSLFKENCIKENKALKKAKSKTVLCEIKWKIKKSPWKHKVQFFWNKMYWLSVRTKMFSPACTPLPPPNGFHGSYRPVWLSFTDRESPWMLILFRVNHRRVIFTEEKAKVVAAVFSGGRIASIPFRASYFTPGWFEE